MNNEFHSRADGNCDECEEYGMKMCIEQCPHYKHIVSNQTIIEAYAYLDDILEFERQDELGLTRRQMFDMGLFYQWADPIIENHEHNRNEKSRVPDTFVYVIDLLQSFIEKYEKQ
ncbi:MAG: hypothetical protein HF312_17125 [Ignavibacteria bacterium]|jgi:hypothetical protein|nr:hypothetical protein [Ignavibacteria bacterium]